MQPKKIAQEYKDGKLGLKDIDETVHKQAFVHCRPCGAGPFDTHRRRK